MAITPCPRWLSIACADAAADDAQLSAHAEPAEALVTLSICLAGYVAAAVHDYARPDATNAATNGRGVVGTRHTVF